MKKILYPVIGILMSLGLILSVVGCEPLIIDGRGTADEVGDLGVETINISTQECADAISEVLYDELGEEIELTPGDYLVITYFIEYPWCLTETHLHVAGDETDIPQTRNGNPIPGQFDFKGEHSCLPGYVYFVPLGNWEPGDEVVIAAHASVLNDTDDLDETAWCEGEDFDGKNWAMYREYEIEEPEDICEEL